MTSADFAIVDDAAACDPCMAALLKKSGIPRRYAAKAVPTDRYNRLLDGGQGLYIVGGTGCGKTHLSWEILLGYLRSHMAKTPYGYRFDRTARLIPADDLLEEIRSTYDGDGSSSEVIAKYSNCDLLVLDDFGKEAPSSWTRAKLFAVINHRYNDCKATVVTSQYTPDRLVERLGRGGGADDAEAIRSRLREMCVQVPMKGGDRRIVGA